MSEYLPVNAYFMGRLNRETIINLENDVFVDQPGGNLLYTAYSYRLWQKQAGFLAKVSEDFPEEWIKEISQQGFNTKGIKRISGHVDDRRFYAIRSDDIDINNPQKYFNSIGQPFPKNLLGYSSNEVRLDSRKSSSITTIKPEDVPQDYFSARFLFICPLDFISHSLIPAFFRSHSEGEVFFHPSRSYMNTSFFFDFPPLIRGAAGFFTSEKELLDLFTGKSKDTWEIAEWISGFGVGLVVISTNSRGYLLYDGHNQKRYLIPSYPSRVVDPIGVDDAFYGGFLAGYTTQFDPVRAVQMGSISASIKIEGSTARYLLGALPDLAQARLSMIKDQIEIC